MRFGWHLKSLFDFNGRENRQPFWLWVLIIYGAQMVIGWIVGAVVAAGLISQVMTMAQRNPDPGANPFKDHPEIVFGMMKPYMQGMMVVGAIMAVITIALLAAAAFRRLHDRNMSGWWSVPVMAWHLASPIVAALALPRMFDAMAKMQTQMGPGMRGNPGLAMMNGDLAWVQLVQWTGLLIQLVLVVFLALPGTAGTNRFGPDPLEDGKLPRTFT